MSITFLTYLLKILSLVPIIAQQVHQTHKDIASKQTAAQDALSAAITDSVALLPDHEQSMAQTIGAIAQGTLANTISALHNQ